MAPALSSWRSQEEHRMAGEEKEERRIPTPAKLGKTQ
jgi:hypothetical protein